MSEQAVSFVAGDLRLEGMFSSASFASPGLGAVICHPHPAYGGAMDNNVVLAVARALQDTGHATLRFNFRGVGHSEGRYADGVGETEDVRAAIAFVRDQLGGGQAAVVLAGYSFGSWVAANALEDDASVSCLILVAPPTSMFDFSALSRDTEERARHFIVGDRDQFCDRDALQDLYKSLPEPKSTHVVPLADHFFFAREQALDEIVREIVADRSTK